MHEKSKIKLTKWAIIVVIWMLVGLIISIYDHYLILSTFEPGTLHHYGFFQNALLNIVAGFLGSLMGGWFLLYYMDEKFRDKTYALNVEA